MPIIKQCAQCGKTIKVSPSKNSKYNFCNRECYKEQNQARSKRNYYKNLEENRRKARERRNNNIEQ